jgi:hypothetical protein
MLAARQEKIICREKNHHSDLIRGYYASAFQTNSGKVARSVCRSISMYSMYSGASEEARFGVRLLGALMVVIGLWMCVDSVRAFRADKKVKFGRGTGVAVSPKYTFTGGSVQIAASKPSH